jgi:hypothetical protein
LPGETEEKPRKTSVRINGLRAEIWTKDYRLLNEVH